MNDLNTLAACFKALGDPTRLKIFEYLRGCAVPVTVDDCGAVRPVDGPTVGEVCCRVTGIEKATPAISFHLKELRQAGLITMERRGRSIVCAINPETLAPLIASLQPPGPDAGGCCE